MTGRPMERGRGRAGADAVGEVAELYGELPERSFGLVPRRPGRGLPPLTTNLVYVLELR